MDLGKAFKIARKSKGITQKELAEKVGMSHNSISNIEKGASFPPGGTLKKMCDGIGVSTGYVLFCTLEREDIPEAKRELFDAIGPRLKEALLNYKPETARREIIEKACRLYEKHAIKKDILTEDFRKMLEE